MTLNDAFYQLKKELLSLYDEGEASAIAHEYLNHLTGLSKYERLIEKENLLDTQQLSAYHFAMERLRKGAPLQYITGKQWFMNLEFEVNEHVLIPRPETEELIYWIANDYKNNQTVKILDIGTGSGCIPVSLKLVLPQAKIYSCDVSDEALMLAEKNALRLGADIELVEVDFLNEDLWQYLDQFDVIISNPPYIPYEEKKNMHVNVLGYEPSLALFVPDDDPLLFYKKICKFSQKHLRENGNVYCEVHKANAYETQALFEKYFSEVTLQKDMNDNERMVKATKS